MMKNKINNQQAKDLYIKFLTTPSEQWNGVIALPVKGKISNAFIEEDKIAGINIGQLIENYLQNGKKVYLWSDHHFYHYNIIKYANRPFYNMEEMISKMISNYNQLITNDDLVIFGGDISFASDEMTSAIINSLNGRKVLIYGNHDINKGKLRNLSSFTEGSYCASIVYPINGKDYNIIISHYPITTPLPPDTINIHGHTHQHLMGKGRLNMCVEHTNYSPKLLSDILKDF